MKRAPIFALCLFALLVAAIAESTARAEDPVWKPIADGKTLAGWHKNGLGDWTVEDGAFVGRSNKAQLYGHLVSDASFQNFTVRFQFQCTSGDSGFFIRTRMEEPDKTRGLQIQVGPCGSGTGGIYESYGRGWLQKPEAEQEAFCYREGTWNQMMITADGPHVVVHVNGFKTADLNDEKIKQETGVFALQMHSRVVNHTVFRHLEVLERGTILPRAFLYDAVKPVSAAEDGTVVLRAADAMSVGSSITYMPEWGALGSFTDQDQVYWPVAIQHAGTYTVHLGCSAVDGQAGRAFAIVAGDQRLTGTVQATGSRNAYREAKIGTLQLSPGTSRITLQPVGTFPGKELMNLRQIKLVPTKE